MGRCIICAEEGSEKVDKDSNFISMMDLYWKSVRVDVKPEWNKDLDLCLPCFDSVLQFYQVNDILVYFETRLKQLQRSILATNLLGIQRCQEKQITLHKLQRSVVNEWGTSLEVTPEVKAADLLLSNYKVTLDFEDPNQDNSSKKTKDKTSREIRKEAVDSTESSTEGSKSPVKKRRGASKTTACSKDTSKRRRINSTDSDGTLEEEETEDSESDESSLTSNSNDEVAQELEELQPMSRRSTRRTMKSKENASKLGGVDAASWTKETDCKICLDKFPTFSAYQKHYKFHKVAEADRLYECRSCNQSFTRQSKLVDHKKSCIIVISSISDEEITISLD